MADCWTEAGEYQGTHSPRIRPFLHSRIVDELAAALFEKYTAFVDRIEGYKLQDAVDSPPLLSVCSRTFSRVYRGVSHPM